MGWKCNTCGESTESDNLDFVMMHDPTHDVQPSVATAVRWAGLIGGSK